MKLFVVLGSVGTKLSHLSNKSVGCESISSRIWCVFVLILFDRIYRVIPGVIRPTEYRYEIVIVFPIFPSRDVTRSSAL